MNERIHWSKRHRRAASERKAAFLMMPRVEIPCTVKMTRVAPRALDDDNLRGSLKNLRDGIADRLGVDDRSPLVKWEYAQERGPARHYSVVVEVPETLA